jgi:outer membrane protein TolC
MVAIAFVVEAPAQTDWLNPESVSRAAIASSPAVARLEAEISAAQERRRTAGTQPNPMLMAGIRDKQIDFTDDEMMSMYMVGASQTLTRPGKRAAARSIASFAVTAAEGELAATRAEIEREVLFAYYDLATVDSQTSAAEQVRGLLDAITDAARVRYEVGNAEQAEVIRAQLERSEIDEAILTLRGARRNAVARLLPMLGLPPATEVPRIELHRSTGALELGGPVEVPSDHPAVAAAEAEVSRREEEIRLARLITKPDLNVEVSYGARPQQKDMFSVIASVELPIRRDSTVEPRIREALAMRDAAQRRVEEVRRTILSGLAVAAAAHQQANEQLALQSGVLLPQARLAFESTLASYQTGKSTFDAVLGAEDTYLRLQLDHVTHYSEHVKAITDFRALRRGARAGGLMGGGR